MKGYLKTLTSCMLLCFVLTGGCSKWIHLEPGFTETQVRQDGGVVKIRWDTHVEEQIPENTPDANQQEPSASPEDSQDDRKRADAGSIEIMPVEDCPGKRKEVCNGIDDDCDGKVDEGTQCPWQGNLCYKGLCHPSCSVECPYGLICQNVGLAHSLCLRKCKSDDDCIYPPRDGCIKGFCYPSCYNLKCPETTDCKKGKCVPNPEKIALAKIAKLPCSQIKTEWSAFLKKHQDCQSDKDCTWAGGSCRCKYNNRQSGGVAIHKSAQKLATWGYMSRLEKCNVRMPFCDQGNMKSVKCSEGKCLATRKSCSIDP